MQLCIPWIPLKSSLFYLVCNYTISTRGKKETWNAQKNRGIQWLSETTKRDFENFDLMEKYVLIKTLNGNIADKFYN